MDSDWLRTLKHFDDKKYFRNGLTIPFLCGANTVVSNSELPISIEELINEICKDSFDYEISILKCGGLNEFVFGILDSYSKSAYDKYLKNGREIYLKVNNIYVTDGSIQNIIDKQKLIDFFNKIYSKKVSDRQYSKNEGKWNGYTPKETSRLNEVKKAAGNK